METLEMSLETAWDPEDWSVKSFHKAPLFCHFLLTVSSTSHWLLILNLCSSPHPPVVSKALKVLKVTQLFPWVLSQEGTLERTIKVFMLLEK